ncbi:MAG: ankyrin repeat domain-containing protein [Parachlamydiales bacterium]|nr:ankyrin repeat domain-containing protein [Parachlamydiales bacterium]
MNDYNYSAKYSNDSSSWSVARIKNGQSEVVHKNLHVYLSEEDAISHLANGQYGLIKVDDKNFRLITNHHGINVVVKTVFNQILSKNTPASSQQLTEKLNKAIRGHNLEEIGQLVKDGAQLTRIPSTLIAACINEDQLTILSVLFKHGLKIDQKDPVIINAILNAAQHGIWETVIFCVENGNINLKKLRLINDDKEVIDLISIACSQVDGPAIEFCINQGLTPLASPNNLITLILSNHEAPDDLKNMLVSILIDQGSKVLNFEQDTPLLLLKSLDMQNNFNKFNALFLLEVAAEEFIELDQDDQESAREIFSEIAFDMIKYCDISFVENPYREILIKLINMDLDLDAENDQRMTLAHIATQNADLTILDALINKGVDLKKRNIFNLNCLDSALKGFSVPVVQRLLQEPLNINTSKSTHTPIQQAIISNNQIFVELLIDKGVDLDNALPLAITYGNLQIIELVDPSFSLNDYLISSKEDAIINLSKLFINSPLPILVKHLQNFDSQEIDNYKTAIVQMMNVLPLIARFNTIKSAGEMQSNYGMTGEFTKQQIEYGELIKKAVSEVPISSDPIDMMKQYSIKRQDIAKSRSDKYFTHYSTMRYLTNEQFYTPMANLKNPGRYSVFIPLVQETHERVAMGEADAIDLTSNDSFILGYQQMYRKSNGDTLNLTQIAITPLSKGKDAESSEWMWKHASNDAAKDGMKELKRLHQTLLHSKDAQEQYRLIAEIYWLGSNLTLFQRGSAQYVQMYADKMAQHFNLDPLIPKIDYPLADCVALTIPCEEFIENFFSYFEPINVVNELSKLVRK